jgi:hypothetical protein
MKIVLAGSMVFLERMSAIKVELESMGHSVVMPSLTEDEIATGKDTFTEYLHSVGGIENVLPDNDIWKMKEEDKIREDKSRQKSRAALYNAQLEGWANKVYGEDWRDYYDENEVEEKFWEWTQKKQSRTIIKW